MQIVFLLVVIRNDNTNILAAALWGVHPNAAVPPQSQILPSKNRTSRMTRIKLRPPLGAHPECDVCESRDSALNDGR